MRIALVGYGRMGHEIESVALRRGHEISLIVDIDNASDLNAEKLKSTKTDVVIEFSFPTTAFDNVRKCLECKVPVVSGTTGWSDKFAEAEQICLDNDTSFIHSSNFSIGVNILFKLNAVLSKYLENYDEYMVNVEETHHIKKLDAPSGTAISLMDAIIANNSRFDSWSLSDNCDKRTIPVKAFREGNVPGIHTVTWDSDIDTITISHEAKNRRGLALGAVVAAEYICNRKGVFTMSDVLGL